MVIAAVDQRKGKKKNKKKNATFFKNADKLFSTNYTIG